jgi:hypothetical protein
MAVKYLDDGNADGWSLGQGTTSKAGVHGAAVVQAAHITSVSTTASTASSPVGYATTTQADAIVTAVNAILVALRNKGVIASS